MLAKAALQPANRTDSLDVIHHQVTTAVHCLPQKAYLDVRQSGVGLQRRDWEGIGLAGLCSGAGQCRCPEG